MKNEQLPRKSFSASVRLQSLPSIALLQQSTWTLHRFDSHNCLVRCHRFCGWSRFMSTSMTLASSSLSSSKFESKFAAVDHSIAYETAMNGSHGHQLALAQLEGVGKDDAPYDPFAEMEEWMHSQKQLQEHQDQDALEEGVTVKNGHVAAAAGAAASSSSTPEFSEKEDHDDIGKDERSDENEYDDDDDDDDEEGIMPIMYNKDGSVRRTKTELATLRAGAPAGGLIAIIELAGTQYKVTTDDVLVVSRLKPVQIYAVGTTHTLHDVLLVSSSHFSLVGMPYVSGAQVDVLVEEVTRDAKVIVFKKRRRKNSQRRNGDRRDVTLLRILAIRPPLAYHDQVHRPRIMSTIHDAWHLI